MPFNTIRSPFRVVRACRLSRNGYIQKTAGASTCTTLVAADASKRASQVFTYWDSLAGVYDENALIAGPTYPDILRRLVHEISGEDEVLEVAAGTGLITVHLAERAARVTCTDLSPRMLGVACAKLAHLDNVTMRQADAAALPFAACSFDVVVCCNALHVMDMPEMALREFRRVLRWGGRLVAITLLDGEMSPGMIVRSAIDYFPRFGYPPARRTLDLPQFEELVASAGLRVESAVLVTERPLPTGYVVGCKRSRAKPPQATIE